jgi:hypothetical protein
MTGTRNPGGFPLIALAVLAVGSLAALLLAVGLWLAVRAQTLAVAIEITPTTWPAQLRDQDPTPFFAMGLLLLLALPILRDALLALSALRQRQGRLAALGLLGVVLLTGLYLALWRRTTPDVSPLGARCERPDGCVAPENPARGSPR